MTQEEKQLLLKDICARLPYGVVIEITSDGGIMEASYNMMLDAGLLADLLHSEDDFKPYLRPMSSMTEEEFLEYHNIKYNKVTYRNNYERIDVGKFHNVGIVPIEDYLDWLNAHHFDYRGLIEKGLAFYAPEGMYKIK